MGTSGKNCWERESKKENTDYNAGGEDNDHNSSNYYNLVPTFVEVDMIVNPADNFMSCPRFHHPCRAIQKGWRSLVSAKEFKTITNT